MNPREWAQMYTRLHNNPQWGQQGAPQEQAPTVKQIRCIRCGRGLPVKVNASGACVSCGGFSMVIVAG